MNLDSKITTSGLREFGFVRRTDLIKKLVDDCWSNRNLIIYRHQNSTEWHVQVDGFDYAAVLSSECISTYTDLQTVYFQANGEQLNL